MRFEGVRYINQDGILVDEGQVGSMESGMNRTSVGVARPPPITARTIRDGKQEPAATWTVGADLEEVLMGDRHPTDTTELFPVDFFADPSILFSGPSSTGFTGIDGQRIAGGTSTCFFHRVTNLHSQVS